MSYKYSDPRKTNELMTHGKFPLKLMIEHERNTAYFYVEYGGHKIGSVWEKIGSAQRLYKNILAVLKLEAGV